MPRSEPRNKSDLSRHCGMAKRLTRQRFCTSFFSWHDVLLKGPYDAYSAVWIVLVLMMFLPLGFAQMVVLDTDFQKKYYKFTFVRREFLGEIRCLVIDVEPRHGSGTGRFLGRMWVEDQDYNVVRFNGTYSPHPKLSFYLHFDSWRLNLQPGMWLPAYIYSEESDLKYRMGKSLHFKAQTRLWGYDLKGLGKNEEFTQILVDSPQSVKDQSEAAADATPVVATRMWERQAEDNAVDRMTKIGLLAPPGEVDKVLLTVVN